MGKAVIAAGIGCRKGAAGEAVLAALDAALGARGLSRTNLHALASLGRKAAEPGLLEAAHTLAIPLHGYSAAELAAFEHRTLTRSQNSLDATGVACVSEAAALAAAGAGARLLGPRLACGPVTCALAIAEGRP